MTRRPTVLIVEDEALVREVMCLEFRDAGFEVIEAGDSDAAISHIDSDQPIDLLFTDIRLPGQRDGFGLADAARARRPELPVIYATGFTPDEVRLVPNSRFFRKPYWPRAVVEAAGALGVTSGA